MTDYPDISDIIARKRQGRRNLATMTFGQKIEWCEAAWKDLSPMREARLGAKPESANATGFEGK